MNSFKECPKCAKDGLTIPVYEGFEGMVCSLCNSVYDK